MRFYQSINSTRRCACCSTLLVLLLQLLLLACTMCMMKSCNFGSFREYIDAELQPFSLHRSSPSLTMFFVLTVSHFLIWCNGFCPERAIDISPSHTCLNMLCFRFVDTLNFVSYCDISRKCATIFSDSTCHLGRQPQSF